MTKSQKEDYDQMKKDQEKEKAKGAKQSEKKIDQQIKEVKKEAKPKKEPKPKPEGESKKNPLNPEQFLSTRDPEMNRKMIDIMTKANLLNDVLNKDNTWVALRTPAESTKLAARKFIERNGKTGKVAAFELGTLGSNTNGFVSRYKGQWRNIAFKIKIEPGSVIDFEGFNFEINDSVIESVLKKNPGWKITNSGNLGKPLGDGRFQIMAEKIGGKWKWEGLTEAAEAIQVKKNIAPLITHESGHALHNSYDPGFIKANELMKKYRFTLMDSPSIYGQTNQAEFIVENFTAYVYDNAGFKKNFPNQFSWIEEWMDSVGIDKKTVTLAK